MGWCDLCGCWSYLASTYLWNLRDVLELGADLDTYYSQNYFRKSKVLPFGLLWSGGYARRVWSKQSTQLLAGSCLEVSLSSCVLFLTKDYEFVNPHLPSALLFAIPPFNFAVSEWPSNYLMISVLGVEYLIVGSVLSQTEHYMLYGSLGKNSECLSIVITIRLKISEMTRMCSSSIPPIPQLTNSTSPHLIIPHIVRPPSRLPIPPNLSTTTLFNHQTPHPISDPPSLLTPHKKQAPRHMPLDDFVFKTVPSQNDCWGEDKKKRQREGESSMLIEEPPNEVKEQILQEEA
ncbi:hypothetical protein Tco_0795633 [Tanacetum coccineum]